MSTYLEACKAALGSFDAHELSNRPLGENLGQGSHFNFRSLGKTPVSNATVEYVGLKVPILHWPHGLLRMVDELALIDLATQVTPAFLPHAPSFMGLVKVEGSKSQAVITEDASQSGQRTVISRAASPEVRRMLHAPFKELGSESAVLDTEKCHKSISFDIEGYERVLDLYSPPISFRVLGKSDAYQAARDRVEDSLDALTVTIPLDSLLGQALHESPTVVH